MRRLSSILITLFILTCTSVWLSERIVDAWAPELRDQIEIAAGKALGLPVHITRLHYGFPLSLHLIQVEAHPIFRADDISVHLSPFNLPTAFLRQNAFDTIGFIRFEHPHVRLTQADIQRFHSTTPHSKHAMPNPLFFRLAVEDGFVEWENAQAPGHPWTMQEVQGLFKWRGPQQSLSIQAKSQHLGDLHFDYSAFGRRWKSALTVEDLDIQKLIDQMTLLKGSAIIPESVKVEGRLDFALHAGGRGLPSSPSGFLHHMNNLHWQVSHGKVSLQKEELPWSSHGSLVSKGPEFVIQNGLLRLDRLTWDLFGSFNPYKAEKPLAIQARSQQVDIAPLMRFIHAPTVLSGKGDLILRTGGPIHDIHSTVQILMSEGAFYTHPIQHLSMLALYSNHAWTVIDSGFQMDTGHLRIKGTWAEDHLALAGTAEQIPLRAITTTPAKGTLSAAFQMDGEPEDWQLRGSWWLSDLAWKDKTLGANWRGDMEMNRSGAMGLNGESTDHALALHAHATYAQSMLQVTEAVIELPQSEKVSGQGIWSFTQRSATFSVVAAQLTLPAQTIRDLHVDGLWHAPDVQFNITGHHHLNKDVDPTFADISGHIHLYPKHMVFDDMYYHHKNITVTTKANLEWPNVHVPFKGDALVLVTGKTSETKIPIQYDGHLEPDAQYRGDAHIISGPAQADLSWNDMSDISIKAHLDKGGWNSLPLHLDMDGHWKQNDDSVFNIAGHLDPDGQLAAQVKVKARRVWIDHAIFRTAESRVELLPGGTFDFPAGADLQTHLSAKLRNLHVGFLTFFGSLDLDGQWANGKDHVLMSAQARTHSLFINDYELDEGQILARWESGVLHFSAPKQSPALITGEINFQHRPQLIFNHLQVTGKEGQHLDVDGEMGPTRWNYGLQGDGLDLGILGEISGLSIPMSGTAQLRIIGKGDAQHPNVEGHARIQQGRIADVQYESGETDFIWQEDRIIFQNLRLKDAHRYSAVGGGVFPIRSKLNMSDPLPDINFTVRLEDTNLGFLQSMFPEIKSARGDVEGLVQVQGTLDQPAFRGHLLINNGDIVGAHYFRHLKNIRVAADFDRDHLRISEIRAHSGDGDLLVQGDVGLSGFLPSDFNLSAETLTKGGLEIEVPELAIPDSPLAKRFKFLTSVSHINVNGHVKFTGSAEAPTFAGDVTLANGHFTFPPSAKKSQPSALSVWARRILWDVQLHFQDKAWFENELVEANVNGAFHLKGTGDALVVDGGLTIPQGKISYLGLQFDIREARFDMKNGVPFLSGQADSQVEATDTVGLSGGVNTGQRFSVEDTITLTIPYSPIDQLKPQLASSANPNLSQDKVLARVTQLDIDNLTPEERSYLYQKQAVSLIDNSLTTPLAQKILKRTGIADRFRAEHVFDPSAAPPVDPITGQPTRSTTAADLFANTKYTVEKDLLSNLSIGYGVRFIPTVSAETNARTLDLVSDLQMSYRAFKNVYVRGNYDLPNSNPSIIPEKKVTIEPRWRFGWWGNTNPPKPQTPKASSQN